MFLFLGVRDILKRMPDRNGYARLTFGPRIGEKGPAYAARASQKSRRHCSAGVGMPDLPAKRADLPLRLLPR